MSVTSRYTVAGMTCGKCVEHVTEELQGLSGIIEVNLDVAGSLTIVSETALDLTAVEAAVAEAGDYTVTPVG